MLSSSNVSCTRRAQAHGAAHSHQTAPLPLTQHNSALTLLCLPGHTQNGCGRAS